MASDGLTPRPWLVLPTFEEVANLEPVVDRALAALAPVCPDGFRILVVDDRSRDGTAELADALAARHPDHVEVLHRIGPRGLGQAYLAGFGRALAGDATHVFEMDADLSHDPADLPRLLAAVQAGAALAVGSRYVPGGAIRDWGLVRRVLSRGGSEYARRVLGVPVRDLTSGFKCFDAGVLRELDLATIRSRGYVFQVELTWRVACLGGRVAEVPITFRDRVAGRSKMDWRIAAEAALLVPGLRSSRRRARA